jgi:hypothetical protein
MSSRPPDTRPARLGTRAGSNVAARSRGTRSGTGPTPVCTVLNVLPFRAFPAPADAPRSDRSYPRCAVISASSARSRTALTSSPSIDPSPVSRRPPASSSDRSSSSSSSPSPISSRSGRRGSRPPPAASPAPPVGATGTEPVAFLLVTGLMIGLPPNRRVPPPDCRLPYVTPLHTR